MNERLIYTVSGTYAAKGRKLLSRNGIAANIRPAMSGGCSRGTTIVVRGDDYYNAVGILNRGGIRFQK